MQLSSIVDCCKWMRDNFEDVVGDSGGESGGRVEVIPVEWHERFNRVSRQNDSNIPGAGLNDISLNTIPHMRSFANDAMLDTLYFMSEPHHDIIIDLVVHELNLVVNKFRKHKRRGFTGKVSIVAHSLGSIITLDILANQKVEGVGGRRPSTPEPMAQDGVVSPSRALGTTPRGGILQSLFGTPPSNLGPDSPSEKEGGEDGGGASESTREYVRERSERIHK